MMSDKQTTCPKCTTLYKVSVAQLTVAQGMVCCPKCSMTFNALLHLNTHQHHEVVNNDHFKSGAYRISTPASPISPYTPPRPITSTQFSISASNLLDIFNLKVEHSNIDLKTYLNNLNYFSTEPIGNYPVMNLADSTPAQNTKNSMRSVIWGCVNFGLLLLLCFQFLWFNSNIIHNSPLLGATYNQICVVLHCTTLQQRYSLMSVNKLKIRSIGGQETLFSGELINYHDNSLPLPMIKVTLKKDGAVDSIYQLDSTQYLIDSLVGIKRIPKNSPFQFKFTLPVSRKSFNHYTLEIVQP